MYKNFVLSSTYVVVTRPVSWALIPITFISYFTEVLWRGVADNWTGHLQRR